MAFMVRSGFARLVEFIGTAPSTARGLRQYIVGCNKNGRILCIGMSELGNVQSERSSEANLCLDCKTPVNGEMLIPDVLPQGLGVLLLLAQPSSNSASLLGSEIKRLELLPTIELAKVLPSLLVHDGHDASNGFANYRNPTELSS